jgi:hypothetical protein
MKPLNLKTTNWIVLAFYILSTVITKDGIRYSISFTQVLDRLKNKKNNTELSNCSKICCSLLISSMIKCGKSNALTNAWIFSKNLISNKEKSAK